MVDQERILQFIRSHGLVLPVQLSSEIKQNTFITGAMLSTLVKSGKVLISNTKVGGSPVYYIKEHEAKLQDLYKNLNEKDKRSYDLLKEKKVLRDTALTPLLHVSVRNLKDFAKAFEVEAGEKKELFWRWYLTPQEEAHSLAMVQISPPVQAVAPKLPEKPVEQPVAAPVAEAAPAAQIAPESAPVPDAKPEPEKPLVQERQQKPIQKPIERQAEKPGQDTQEPALKTVEPTSDSLHEKTKKFFNSVGITVRKAEVIKRNVEIDYLIDVPSAVGPVTYYCKARAKKRCSEGDLAAAFVKGQTKKLPVLFVTTGECTKKAIDMLATDFSGMKVTSLEVKQ